MTTSEEIATCQKDSLAGTEFVQMVVVFSSRLLSFTWQAQR